MKARRPNVNDAEYVLVEETCDDSKSSQGQSMLQALSLARKRSNDRRPFNTFLSLFVFSTTCCATDLLHLFSAPTILEISK